VGHHSFQVLTKRRLSLCLEGLGCAKAVPGGKLVITAKDIQEHSYTRMVLRINYKTLSGDRQRSENINISLFPED
jgi:hypothetical protein